MLPSKVSVRGNAILSKCLNMKLVFGTFNIGLPTLASLPSSFDCLQDAENKKRGDCFSTCAGGEAEVVRQKCELHSLSIENTSVIDHVARLIPPSPSVNQR